MLFDRGASSRKSEQRTVRVAAGFLRLNLIAILLLTLTPSPEWPWQPEKRFNVCILCTADTVSDFLGNILLFVPLGTALAFRCYRLGRAVLFGAVLSLAIEMVQFVIPGRHPHLQDIACNTAGTLLGFGIARSSLFGPTLARILGECRHVWEQLKRPNTTLVNYLVCGVLVIAVGLFALTGALLRPAFPPGAYLFAGQKMDEGNTPLRIGANGDDSGYFKGIIDEVRIYSRALSLPEIRADMETPVGIESRGSVPGLVAAYGFEETLGSQVLDASGQENVGRVHGAVRVAGRFGQALMFDGQRAQVVIPHTPTLNLRSSFTLEAWILPDHPTSSWPAIIQKEGDLFFIYAGADRMLVPSGGGTFGAANEGVAAPEVVAAGAWSHLAATYDGATLRMYLNGRHVASLFRWFQGRVDEMSVGRTPVRPGYVDASWLIDALRKGEAIQLRGTAGPAASDKGALLDIKNRRPGDRVLLIAAQGQDAVIRYFTLGAAFGLPSPEIRVRGALRNIDSGIPLKIEIAGVSRERSLTVNGVTYRGLGFSIGNGWKVFIHSEPLPVWLHELLDIAWLAAWTFLIGFQSRTRLVLLTAVAIFGSILWLFPAFGIYLPTPLVQWAAVMFGFLLGAGTRWTGRTSVRYGQA